MRFVHRIAIVAMLGLFCTIGVHADTIGPSCSSCFGMTYTINNNGVVSSTATTQTYQIVYTINTTGSSLVSTDYISQVALKVTNSALGVSLVSSPAGTWALSTNTNISNNGCSGNGSGWVCAGSTSNLTFLNGSSYSWTFNITMATGSLLDVASIQANFDPPTGLLMSEKVNVPEPSSLALLGSSVLGLLGITRRKFFK